MCCMYFNDTVKDFLVFLTMPCLKGIEGEYNNDSYEENKMHTFNHNTPNQSTST